MLKNNVLYKLLLRTFRYINLGDITIHHHYTKERFLLHSFIHRNYWFHGKKREHATMILFQKLIPTDGVVLDVGGHIGYLTVYFSKLVGTKGHVYVFEPSPNNLPYVRFNTNNRTNVTLIEKGVSFENGISTFYVETLTSQNSSFVKEYTYKRNANRSYLGKSDVTEVNVETISLDRFVNIEGVRPVFVKVDVEGFELEVIKGAYALLSNIRPMFMVEMRFNKTDVFNIFHENHYCMFSPELVAINSPEQIGNGNVFCFHKEVHNAVLERLLSMPTR